MKTILLCALLAWIPLRSGAETPEQLLEQLRAELRVELRELQADDSKAGRARLVNLERLLTKGLPAKELDQMILPQLVITLERVRSFSNSPKVEKLAAQLMPPIQAAAEKQKTALVEECRAALRQAVQDVFKANNA